MEKECLHVSALNCIYKALKTGMAGTNRTAELKRKTAALNDSGRDGKVEGYLVI